MKYGYSTGEDGYGTDLSVTIQRNDNLLTLAVKDRGLNTPPGSPSHGHRYIVGTSPTGAWSGKANQVAAYDGDAAAWLFYAPEKGWSAFVDDEGRRVEYNGSSWTAAVIVLATQFSTIQLAIDACSALGGGVVRVPAGTYNSSSTPSFTGITIPNNVRVIGDGTQITILDMAGQSTSLNAVLITGSWATIEDIGIVGQNASGTGCGVKFGNGGDPARHSWVIRCTVARSPSWAIYFTGSPGSNIWILSGVVETRAYEFLAGGAVYVGPGCTTILLDGCNVPAEVPGNSLYQIDGAVDCIMRRCTGETDDDKPMVIWSSGGQHIRQFIIEDCYFESHSTTASGAWFIEIQGAQHLVGMNIVRNKFARPFAANLKNRILRSTATTIRSVLVQGNTIKENRTSDSPYTDDVRIETGAAEIILRDNVIWDQASGAPRPLAIDTASGGSLAAVINGDYKLFQLPRHPASDESDVSKLPALAGTVYYDTTNNRVRVYIGGTGWVTNS
jgi:hypothetical protein